MSPMDMQPTPVQTFITETRYQQSHTYIRPPFSFPKHKSQSIMTNEISPTHYSHPNVSESHFNEDDDNAMDIEEENVRPSYAGVTRTIKKEPTFLSQYRQRQALLSSTKENHLPSIYSSRKNLGGSNHSGGSSRRWSSGGTTTYGNRYPSSSSSLAYRSRSSRFGESAVKGRRSFGVVGGYGVNGSGVGGGSGGGVDVLRKMRGDIERQWGQMLAKSTRRSQRRQMERDLGRMMSFHGEYSEKGDGFVGDDENGGEEEEEEDVIDEEEEQEENRLMRMKSCVEISARSDRFSRNQSMGRRSWRHGGRGAEGFARGGLKSSRFYPPSSSFLAEEGLLERRERGSLRRDSTKFNSTQTIAPKEDFEMC